MSMTCKNPSFVTMEVQRERELHQEDFCLPRWPPLKAQSLGRSLRVCAGVRAEVASEELTEHAPLSRACPLSPCVLVNRRVSTGRFADVMLKLRLLTWDVKDTLLRLRIPVGESYSAQAQAHGLRVPVETLNRSFRQAYKAQSQRLPNYGRDRGLRSKQWWLDIVMETFRLSGVHDDGVLRPIAEKLYWDYCSARNWELLPGARETLQQCWRLGLPMAVVSNFDRRLQEILTQCNLRQHFQFVLSSEEVGFAKPDKRIFLEALRISGVPPQLAAHVGDHYANDYRAAREAGMHSFLVKTAGQPAEWDTGVPKAYVLPSLPHLLSLIEKG